MASIKTFGWTTPIKTNLKGVIVAGHGEYLAALKEGYTHVPVEFCALDEKLSKAYLVADNETARKAVTEEDKLSELLRGIEEIPDFDIEAVGFSTDEVGSLIETSFVGSEEEAEEEAEKSLEKAEYKNIEKEGITVFHALGGDQIGMVDFYNFLCSYASDGVKIPINYPKNSLLFIDSGALTGVIRQGKSYLSLENQLNIVKFAEEHNAHWVSMLDIPMIPDILNALNSSVGEAYKIHLRNAKAFAEIKTDLRKVFVIQGPGFAEFKRCCEDFKKLVKKEDVVAIGSIKNRAGNFETLEKITSLVKSHFPDNDLHLFGVTTPLTVAKCFFKGATSCDSAAASYSARTGSISTLDKSNDGNFVVKRVPLPEYCGVDFPISQSRTLHTGIAINGMLNTVLAIQLEIQTQKALYESN